MCIFPVQAKLGDYNLFVKKGIQLNGLKKIVQASFNSKNKPFKSKVDFINICMLKVKLSNKMGKFVNCVSNCRTIALKNLYQSTAQAWLKILPWKSTNFKEAYHDKTAICGVGRGNYLFYLVMHSKFY